MFSDILTSLNWIDIIIGAVIARGVFIGVKNGFVVETFKTVGVFFATFVILHYFNKFGGFISNYLWFPPPFSEIIAFILLWLFVSIVFKLIRDGWLLVIKTEAIAPLSKWGGLFLAVIRSLLVCGLTFTLLYISNNAYLIKKAKNSFTGFYLIDLSPYLYHKTMAGFVSKLFPDETANQEVFSLRAREKVKKKK